MNNPSTLRASVLWLSCAVLGLLGWSMGCGPAPATVELRSTPCVHDSQCRVDLGFRCIRLICVSQQPTPPVGDGTITPPADSGPDSRPPTDRPILPDGPPTDSTQCSNGMFRPCYTGAPGTQDVGICRSGTQECVNGSWHLCLNEIRPVAELCGDGKDNNCNGEIDEDCGGCTPGMNRTCGDSDTGVCMFGNQVCTSDKKWGPCEGAVLPTAELCNGKDDDCDGTIDDNPTDEGNPCQDTTQQGECTNGREVCSNGKLNCVSIHASTHEVCNGKDDDCDGLIDNNPSDIGTSCTINGAQPPCQQGTYECTSGALTCVPSHTPTPEDCSNNLDDDCNGIINDGCTPTAEQCKPCNSDAECGGKAICYEDSLATSYGKSCYRPCNSKSDCATGFDCLPFRSSSQKHCGPPLVSSGLLVPMWHCSNYLALKSQKNCFRSSDCGFTSRSGRGGACRDIRNQSDVCTVRCVNSQQCPTGQCQDHNQWGVGICR